MATSRAKLRERKIVSSATWHAARSTPLVLVVDDHEDTRFMLKTLLGTYGYHVVEAGDGVEAVRVVESAHPDLVLMDGSLPRVDGLDATRRIRAITELNSLPIILLSGHAEPAYRDTALAAGCDDFMVKPVDFVKLKSTLESHLAARFSGQREPASV